MKQENSHYSSVKMISSSISKVALLMALIELTCLANGNPLVEQSRVKRAEKNYNVNVQLIVGDGNIQGINSNGAQGGSVNEQCLKCICSGYFPCFITWAYWADAGRPTVAPNSPFEDNAFKNCAANSDCARRTVESYVQKFQQDCNNDGRIDCSDFAAIHSYGGFGGCKGKSKSC